MKYVGLIAPHTPKGALPPFRYGLLLLLCLCACRTKHHATETKRTEKELVATERTEAAQLYTRATEAVTRLTESDSLRITIKDYRPDGSLVRTTELSQGRRREQTDSITTTDSLQAVQTTKAELKATETTTTTRKVNTEAKPSLGDTWWLIIIGVIVVGIFVALGIFKKKLL